MLCGTSSQTASNGGCPGSTLGPPTPQICEEKKNCLSFSKVLNEIFVYSLTGNFHCKRCKKTAYCSVVCQAEDWKAHRHMCKAIEAAVVEFHSPGHFFIVAQSNETLEALQMITVELQKTYSIPSATAHTPVVDEVCAVQFSCDMNWYRGLVQNLAADQNSAQVLYIDFGNKEKVPFERIKPLTAKLQQFGPCAIECCIAEVVPVADAWSGKCCIAVRMLLEGKTLTVKVLDIMQNGLVHAVDIMLSRGMLLHNIDFVTAAIVNKTPTEQDINDMKNASMENFNCHSNGKNDNLWAHVPESLTQAVGDSFSAVVTHFQSPEKIVVQKVENAGKDHCNKVPASSYFRPAPGTVCCALFSEDKQWYRAKILAYSSEKRVCVGYLDFGNSEDVDLSNLRPITPSLLDVPMQAMTCGLVGVQPIGENWSEECLVALQRRVSNRILRIEIQGPHEGKALVTIIDEVSDPQTNISELLIAAGFAVPAVVNISTDQPTEVSLPAPEVPEPLVWTCAVLPSDGQTVTLRLCSVESPGKFFCHIDNPKDVELLMALEAELKPYCEVVSSAFDPKLGEPCCAIIPENGKCFRALVKQLCKDDIMVAIVDYGYCMSLKKNHLRPITNKFLTLPFLAVPCWLAGTVSCAINGVNCVSEILHFQTLVEGEALSARVLSVTEDGYGVELQSKSQSVASALVSENLAIFLGEKGKQEAAMTPNILNESALANRQEQVIMYCLAETSFPVDWKTVVLPVNETFQPSIAAVSSPSLFYLFGPRQADNNWYRAVILEVCDQVASVIYADYGNSEKVSLSDILPIPASFLQLPFQLIRCTLIASSCCCDSLKNKVSFVLSKCIKLLKMTI
uniref:Tudor domain containing 1 n=1 Tax=Periophthalmus magnuspinnatus TaxID=409849 RepID=A0A3B4B491_9GOBI